ncbi:hypothetical protein [Oceanobacillus jeddahense]|uniref:hypothetical protein n=1 Tax=Oceanobacillus jeddahense TaxID=1462527 RepID=UPI000A463AAA|nr:hypothetical protein [Oceanobacillus jeddahense]
MHSLGLKKATIEEKLKRNGVTDKKLAEALAAVIAENNQEIAKKVPDFKKVLKGL